MDNNSRKHSGWFLIVLEYYSMIDKSTAVSVHIIPMMISITSLFMLLAYDMPTSSLNVFSNLIPTIDSILIGFTVMLITILLTSDSKYVNNIKNIKSKSKVFDKDISLFQNMHIQFCYLLITEVLLLIISILYILLQEIVCSKVFTSAFWILACYFTFSVLFGIIRGISNLHFAFFRV